MKTIEKNLEFEAMRFKAFQNDFELKKFEGYALIEIATGCDLHFTNLDDVGSYIDACDLNDAELKNHFEQRRDETEQKINKGARLTNHRMTTFKPPYIKQ